MMMLMSIPALPVVRIDEAVAFYTEKFGFFAPRVKEDFARLVRDEVELHLWAAADESWKNRGNALIDKPIASGAESYLAGTGSCRIGVRGIDELYEEYKKTGVLYNTRTVIETMPWGNREFATLDLYGNLLTFFERG